MYLDTSSVKQGNKTHTRHLLRTSFRQDGKVCHKTIANLSDCTPEEINAIRFALKNKKVLNNSDLTMGEASFQQGLSVGAVYLLKAIADRLGISKILGNDRNGKLALFQVIARIIDQGSRLSAVRLAGSHAACDILGLERFNEENLYANLDWLCENQVKIEDSLYHNTGKTDLFLYDITSSYLEGTTNELADYGYNRDKKTGKKQIVVGLLCTGEGIPVSVEVFKGNTSDSATVGSQAKKAAQRFGAEGVTFVGDRGMIKGDAVEDIVSEGFNYITAITKPQIEKMLREGKLQLSLFETEVGEVITGDIRYVFRRNPVRAEEMKKSRDDRVAALEKSVAKENLYLSEHKKAKPEAAVRRLEKRRAKLKLSWTNLACSGRAIYVAIDEVLKAEEEKLDGCYVLKSDLTIAQADKKTIHERYKGLAMVERGFRTSKTGMLEMRPLNVRLETRTRGHLLVVMLAYRIVMELEKYWENLDTTVEEGIQELTTLCSTTVSLPGGVELHRVPEPRESIKNLLAAANVDIPEILKSRGVKVTTKKKLTGRS